MKISELIKKLQEVEKEEGDIECCTYDSNGDFHPVFDVYCHQIERLYGKKEETVAGIAT